MDVAKVCKSSPPDSFLCIFAFFVANHGSKVMSEFLQITTTTSKRQDAEQIAVEMVSRRLAGCAQVSGPIVSTFRWQGKTETQEEWVCTIKTTSARYPEVQSAIEQIHPYQAPEIIATPIVEANQKYLEWLRGEVS
jgi:periplasmic divalent cation tolerance protein